jgi:hypothetical protein
VNELEAGYLLEKCVWGIFDYAYNDKDQLCFIAGI